MSAVMPNPALAPPAAPAVPAAAASALPVVEPDTAAAERLAKTREQIRV